MPVGPALKELRALVGQALMRHASELGDGPLVVAVSGGTDSTALLLALSAIPRTNRPALVVAHYSHGLRRTAEVREARAVRRLCAGCGVPLETGAGQAGASEEAARSARYAFLAQMAHERGASAVATAHTQDDQAETVLLHLARGSGLRGAGAMPELGGRPVGAHDLRLLRPMLNASRELTEAVCGETGVTPASDGSNRSLRYARNRVRRRVLPELGVINPGVRGALARFASSAQEDDALLRDLAAEAAVMREEPGCVSWDRRTLAKMPGALVRRALEVGWGRMAGEGAMLPAATLRDATRLIQPGPEAELDLSHGMRLLVGRERVVLERRRA